LTENRKPMHRSIISAYHITASSVLNNQL